VLTLGINHGAKPASASYAYTVLPNTTADATSAYAANPTFEILSNTKEKQSVRDKTTGKTLTVYYRNGTVEFELT
jgi:hyaluronate lyase